MAKNSRLQSLQLLTLILNNSEDETKSKRSSQIVSILGGTLVECKLKANVESNRRIYDLLVALHPASYDERFLLTTLLDLYAANRVSDSLRRRTVIMRRNNGGKTFRCLGERTEHVGSALFRTRVSVGDDLSGDWCVGRCARLAASCRVRRRRRRTRIERRGRRSASCDVFQIEQCLAGKSCHEVSTSFARTNAEGGTVVSSISFFTSRRRLLCKVVVTVFKHAEDTKLLDDVLNGDFSRRETLLLEFLLTLSCIARSGWSIAARTT